MRKYMPVLVMIVLLFSFLTVVSAADANDTQDLADSTTISQDKIKTTDAVVTPTDVDKTEIDNTRSNVDTTSPETTDTEEGGDCCSAIIQGYQNDSTISFRVDSQWGVTVNVTHNSSFVIQKKGAGTYFFHSIISADGWIVGNGGTDGETTSRIVEANALKMINSKIIDNNTLNTIYTEKQNSAKGHFVIKAPNGTYALFIHYQGNVYKEQGVLVGGQYLVVPNNPVYFHKGDYKNYTKNSYFVASSRLLAAKDKYGVERRNIFTYYYKRTNATSNVKIYASNDDGRYVNRSTGKLVDGIQTNTRFIPSSSVRNLSGWTNVDDVNFTLKSNTSITSENFTTNDDKISINATIKDEYGNPVNSGFVSVKVNDRTLKYDNGTTIYVNVKNGFASVNHTLPDIWKRTNYTYQFRYYGNSLYESNYGNKAVINIKDIASLTSSHANTTLFGTNLTITANIRFNSNNSGVDRGLILLKVNGKTIRNSENKTLTVNVKDGVAIFNLDLDYRYSPKQYNVTVVYGYGKIRLESTTIVKINKIPTKILSPTVTVKDNTVTVKASFVDKNTEEPIKYHSYIAVKINGKTVKDEEGNARTFNIDNGTIDFSFNLTAKYRAGNHTMTFLIPDLRETLGVRENVTMTIEQ